MKEEQAHRRSKTFTRTRQCPWNVSITMIILLTGLFCEKKEIRQSIKKEPTTKLNKIVPLKEKSLKAYPRPEKYNIKQLNKPKIYESKKEKGKYIKEIKNHKDEIKDKSYYKVWNNKEDKIIREVFTRKTGYKTTKEINYYPSLNIFVQTQYGTFGRIETYEVFHLLKRHLIYKEVFLGQNLHKKSSFKFDNGEPLKEDIFDLGTRKEETIYHNGKIISLNRYNTRKKKHGWSEKNHKNGKIEKQEYHQNGELIKYWLYTYRGDRVISQLYILDPLGTKFIKHRQIISNDL